MCYTEIGKVRLDSGYSLYTGGVIEKRLWDWIDRAEDKRFNRVRLVQSRDIWPAFKKLFGGKI